MVTTADQLLRAYDSQLRARVPDPLPAGLRAELDGPVLRLVSEKEQGFVTYRDLDGLSGDEVDALIMRQVRVFAERGQRFEWKLRGHDRPADLPQRLTAAGFVPEEWETIVIAQVEELPRQPSLPPGLSLREVGERGDLDRIAALQAAVWPEDDHQWLAESLEAELAAGPEALTIVTVESDTEVVCAAWVRFESGTDFATLWGGATLPAWRRQGIYRATVAYRAGLAANRGYRFVSVDASTDSRPILERLGFVAVTTTTPYVWSPPAPP